MKYKAVAAHLWKLQLHKCAYCESRMQQRYQDVEHFRPKAAADRAPGSTDTHGYWWLAWTWENLLFSCNGCNRPPAKGTRFPLAAGSTALVAQHTPPGLESPLLLDPFSAAAGDDPADHIEFRPVTNAAAKVEWFPVPRNGSARGNWSIKVYWLDRPELIDLYTDHVDVNVHRELADLRQVIAGGGNVTAAAQRVMLALCSPTQEYVALSRDALKHLATAAERQILGI